MTLTKLEEIDIKIKEKHKVLSGIMSKHRRKDIWGDIDDMLLERIEIKKTHKGKGI